MGRQKFLIFFLILFVNTAFAQVENKTEFYFNGGLSFPLQPRHMKEYLFMGYNIGLGFGYVSSQSISLIGSFDYNIFSINEENLLRDMELGDFNLNINHNSQRIISFYGNLKYSIVSQPQSFSPYVIGGIGWMRISDGSVRLFLTDANRLIIFSVIEAQSVFSVLFGGGFEMSNFGLLKIFIQGTYRIGFTEHENTNYLQMKVGMILN